MARTLADYLDIAEHAAGGQVDASIDLTQLVNDAGRYLIQMHDWVFLDRPQTLLSTTQDQAYIDLPSDFDKLKGIGNTATNDYFPVKILPPDLFERVKADDVSDQLDTYFSLEWPDQTSTTAAQGVPRLAIYPVPSATEANRYWLHYLAGWVELSANTAVANIPVPMEHLLISLIRAYARGEAMSTGPHEELEKIERSTMLQRLKESYGMVNTEPAPMEGGAAQMVGTNNHWRRHTTITSLTP